MSQGRPSLYILQSCLSSLTFKVVSRQITNLDALTLSFDHLFPQVGVYVRILYTPTSGKSKCIEYP